MNLRRKALAALLLVLVAGLGGMVFAQPVFENRTPRGFSPTDSSITDTAVVKNQVNVLVDLNEPANFNHPVVGNFQKIERSVPYFSTGGTAKYMSQGIAVDNNGVIHRAWVQQRGTARSAGTSPVYGVVYAKSYDGGKTFTDTVSVSGTLRFDMVTPNVAYTSGFSTVDIVVNSKGNPRVVYAMDMSADGRIIGAASRKTTGGVKAYHNINFNYSNDGGSSWLPANSSVVVNDTVTYSGRNAAFPRLGITSTDDIFIAYENDQRAVGTGNTGPDIRLAKVDEDSLKLGSAQAVNIGSLGQVTSGTVAARGGVRLHPAADIGLSPDIAVGDDDVLHVIWYAEGGAGLERVRHKTLPSSLWNNVSIEGWNQVDDSGSSVGAFDPTGNAIDIDGGGGVVTAISVAATANRVRLFPTVVVDRARTPDRAYILYKWADVWDDDENIKLSQYDYDGRIAGAASWSTAAEIFPTGSGRGNQGTIGSLFQNGTRFQIESSWAYTDRVAAVIDTRRGSEGELNIVFSAGSTAVGAGSATVRNSLYYSRFNGTEWELPQVVATGNDNNVAGQPDGVSSNYHFLFEPDVAMATGDNSVYLAFVGGKGAAGAPGRGFGAGNTGAATIAPLPFFKKVGRVVTFDDVSQPKGAYQYVLSYTPTNAQDMVTSAQYNLVTVTAGDNSDGSGVGAATPGTSKSPGGFLTGQWRKVSATSLGLTTLTPTSTSGVYKGAMNLIQATSNTGVFEGKVNDDGSTGYGEWGDDADKVGLLLKANVLGPNTTGTATEKLLYVVNASTAAKTYSGNISQSVNVAGVADLTLVTYLSGVTSEAQSGGATTVPLGSYFQLGARIDIVAANEAPSVSVVSPDATTATGGAFSNETAAIQYTLYDADDNAGAGAATTDLKYELYYYPDRGLSTVQDIRVYGTLIADQHDATAVDATRGTNDFTEGSSRSSVQTYTWDDPGTALQTTYGFASITKALDGFYYIYIVADDGMNKPVWAVSQGPLRVRHIPMVKSVAPVLADTVDTGENINAAKFNPYKVKFQLVDYNDNAQVRLFYSAQSNLNRTNVAVTGTFPSKVLTLSGANAIQLSDTLRTDEDIDFDFDVTAQGTTRDTLVAQGTYYLYAVVADADTFALGVSAVPLVVKHSPWFEFTAPLTGTVDKINTTQQYQYSLQWQRGRSDGDLNGNAIVSLYYTGIDPKVKNYSGSDSTSLVATSGTNPGSAVLITGNIRSDAEGANDQYIWSFRNPPGNLPKVFRPKYGSGAYNAYSYQSGVSVDTAWVYAVLHDSLGNSRVQAGGAVLLLGSQETPASAAPRVVMKTPPAGGMTVVNGDVVRLEWDSFLIDDGTGTDDAYLRLYAAPKNKYTTLTQLEANNTSRGGDVYVINSLDGKNNFVDYTGKTQGKIGRIRESGSNYLLWDTKSTSFKIEGTPTELDIFIAGSTNPRFGENVYVNAILDSVASGLGSQAQKAVLSKAPGALRVEGADPTYSIELGPSMLSAATDDTLSFQVLANSQGSSIDLMAFYLNVPRNYFDVVDMDANTAGLQPFADSTGAFKTASTIAQNDTTQGTDQYIKLNFVESIIVGEVVGNGSRDSSQVAATLRLVAKRFPRGAPQDTTLTWSTEPGRKTAFRSGKTEMAAPAREATVKMTPRAHLISTVPLEGRPSTYADTLDIHMRLIGSTHDIVDQRFIDANDITKDTLLTGDQLVTIGVSGSSSSITTLGVGSINVNDQDWLNAITELRPGQALLADSVQVLSDKFGTFMLEEIPPGIYEMTVKAKGYITGRTDTLNLFNGVVQTVESTFGSDLLGNLSPATPIGFLRGGDATGDNQVDIADANRIFSLWNKTRGDAAFAREADINADGLINVQDLGFVTTNFGNSGYGAAPVFKRSGGAGDNSAAVVQVTGLESVEAWWPGKVFAVTARVTGMSDVAAYGLTVSYDPQKVQPLETGAVTEGSVFSQSPNGSLFFQKVQPGQVDVTGGRIGRDWSATGDADLATVWFVALGNDPGQIEVTGGQLVNSDYRGTALRGQQIEALPTVAALYPNYPNPFNPSTELRFDVPAAGDVQLKVYNQLGQTVRTLVDQRLKAGSYRMKWDGRNEAGQSVASGVYFYRLQAGEFNQIRKMTLVK